MAATDSVYELLLPAASCASPCLQVCKLLLSQPFPPPISNVRKLHTPLSSCYAPPLSPALQTRIFQLLIDVARGMEALHAQDIVHGELRPGGVVG